MVVAVEGGGGSFDAVAYVAGLVALHAALDVAGVGVAGVDVAEAAVGVGTCRALVGWAQALSVRLVGVLDRAVSTGGAGVGAVEGACAQAGLSRREARRQTAVARAIGAVPALGDAVASGVMSVEHAAKVAEVMRSAPQFAQAVAEDPESLVAAASAQSVDEFASTLRDWRVQTAAETGMNLLEHQRSRRRCAVFAGDLDMVELSASLPPDGGAVVKGALDAIADELWRREHPERNPTRLDDTDTRARYADALVELATRAMHPNGALRARPRPLLIAHVEVAPLGLAAHATAEIEGIGPIPDELLAEIACGADTVGVLFDGPGKVLRLGRTQRLATDDQWTALRARDRGCVFPDCQMAPQHCDAHHLREWHRHHGPTDTDWLALVCPHHHRAIHTGTYTLTGPAHQLRITTGNTRDGPVIVDRTTTRSRDPAA